MAEPPGATSFEATPEPEPSADILVGWSRNLNHFLMAGGKLKRNVLLLYYVNMKSAQFVKTKWSKNDFFYLLIIKFFRSEMKNDNVRSRSRPFLPGAGVGSGTSDVRSHLKKWRLHNTGR